MNETSIYLIATSVSFVIHFVLLIPFINYLYHVKMQRAHQQTQDPFGKGTPIFDQHHSHKAGTPVGGGILVILITCALYLIYLMWFVLADRTITSNYASRVSSIIILIFTMTSFGLLGLYDDLSKIYLWSKSKFFGLRMRQKLVLELGLAGLISGWLYFVMGIDLIHIPFLGAFHLSYGYIIYAMFIIVAFANAVNITDGLDGLSTGTMMIALIAFWIISRSIIDVSTSVFIAVWLGGLLAFLYFNVYPARIWLGDTGALSFGAVFAVIGLILGKSFALPIIGGVFVIEVATSGIQLLSKRLYKRKVFAVSPLHLWLQHRGWQEPKVVFRFWIGAILCAVFGLITAFMK